MGKSTDRLIWEAPQKDQQAALVRRFGANVSLGNVAAREALALEALRSGLRYETLSQIVECERAAGQWDPAVLEAPDEPPATESALREVSSHG